MSSTDVPPDVSPDVPPDAPPAAHLDDPVALQAAVIAALHRRAPLLEALEAEGTDSLRLFHGAVEGREGLTVDRYGPLCLVQTWRRPLDPAGLAAVAEAVEAVLPGLHLCWNHRSRHQGDGVDTRWHVPAPAALATVRCREQGRSHRIRARHRGMDPWAFLDFRCARRWLFANAADKAVLNLFAYTATAGLAAACGGAAEVVNIDFADSALQVGADNAADNSTENGGAFDLDADRFHLVQADVIPALRQLAGQRVKGRAARRRSFRRFDPRAFDLVVLDPPTWATSAFGAVDIVRDYESLFKPAVLATKPGGIVLATNHAASVDEADWHGRLRRCAEKAGRPLADLEVLRPEADFPSPDDQPPLKIALCRVGAPS